MAASNSRKQSSNKSQSRDENIIVIDGRTLEGGGQVLRNSLTLSSLLAIPFNIHSIRGNRQGGGGLLAQHLACVTNASKLCGAAVQGVGLKSKELIYRPADYVYGDDVRFLKPKPWEIGYGSNEQGIGKGDREWEIRIGGVGSIYLLLQALLPYILYSPAPLNQDGESKPLTLTIYGGTNGSFSPSHEYATQVFFPTLSEKLGYPSIQTTLHRRGWTTGPTIPGKVTLTIPSIPAGTSIGAVQMLDRGDIVKFTASFVVPRDQCATFRETIEYVMDLKYPDIPFQFVTDDESGHDKRYYLLLVAITGNGYRLGRDWLYDRKITSPDRIAETMITTVLRELNVEIKQEGCLDTYLQDQLVVFQSLAKGTSGVNSGSPASLHTKTARWVVEQFSSTKWSQEVSKLENDKDGEQEVVEKTIVIDKCEGIGLVSGSHEVLCSTEG